MSKGYASFTIADLVDSATYIYYAENETGDGVASTPSLSRHYIGFYSGPSIEGGAPFADQLSGLLDDWIANGWWSGWTRVVGESGDTPIEKVYYARSNNGNIPPVENTPVKGPFDVLYETQGGNEEAILTIFKQGATFYLIFEDEQLGARRQDGTIEELSYDGELVLAGPSNVWFDYVPNIENGDEIWLWTKHVIEYKQSGYAEIWYNVTKDGVDGTGIAPAIIKYQHSDNGTTAPAIKTSEDLRKWLEEQPAPQPGRYLWTWYRWEYTDETFTDSFTPVYQGVDGNQYHIESNQDEILVFYMDDSEHQIETSPQSFEIYLSNQDGQNIELYKDTDGSNFKFGFISTTGDFISLTEPAFEVFWNIYVQTNSDQVGENNGIKEQTSLVFEFQRFLNAIRNGAEDLLQGDNLEYFDSFCTQHRASFIREETGKLPISVPIKFSYLLEDKEVALKIFSLKEGTEGDLLSFAKTATKINIAIQNKAMEFKSTGLSLYGAAFEMWNYHPETDKRYVETDDTVPVKGKTYYTKKDETYYEANVDEGFSGEQYYELINERVLYAEGGNLCLKGTVYANNGFFNGQINAKEGKIGGFTILDGRLQSTAKIEGDSPAIELIGDTGKIIANSMELGNDIVLKGQIKLEGADGTAAYLYGPGNNGNIFLQAGDIAITTDGGASFGEISINGQASTIEASGWRLTPDTAYLNNAVVSGVIETAQFKTGTTQAIGSTMLLLPSYEVDNFATNEFDSEGRQLYKVVLKDTPVENQIEAVTQVWLVHGNTYHKFVCTDKNNGKEVEIRRAQKNNQNPLSRYTAMLVIGKLPLDAPGIGSTEEECEYAHEVTQWVSTPANSIPGNRPMAIGINGTNVDVMDGLIRGRGLTITEFETQKDKLPTLFLGDLEVLGEEYSGYGLFSENAYLTGSLTTKSNPSIGSYAGINTLSNVTGSKFDGQETIVFWAGAASTTADGIKNAPFQVTAEGSVYAERARLTESLLVGSVIETSILKTAEIYGTDGLTIYDALSGIVFKKQSGGQGIEVFSIGQDGMHSSGKYFINITENGAEFTGKEFKTRESERGQLSLTTKDGVPALYHYGITGSSSNCGFYFDKEATYYQIVDQEGAQRKIQWTPGETVLYNTITYSQFSPLQRQVPGQRTLNLQYRPVAGGYDLYIMEVAT